jgi:hypothetical protein
MQIRGIDRCVVEMFQMVGFVFVTTLEIILGSYDKRRCSLTDKAAKMLAARSLKLPRPVLLRRA